MLNIILLILLVIAVAVIVQQLRYRQRFVKTAAQMHANLTKENQHLYKVNGEKAAAYRALEIGMDEQAENYEMQFLSFRDAVTMAKNSAEYDRQAREEAERLSALKDLVIENHAHKCPEILEEVVNEMVKALKPEEKLVHNHASYEKCDVNNCKTDRYVDGLHVFTDKEIQTQPADG